MDGGTQICSYRDLKVWDKAMDLVAACYAITKGFPKEERYGLTSQLQRAAVSVPANIAEGRARQHRAEFLQHLSIALGSLAELETHVQIAERLGYLNSGQSEPLLSQCAEIGRMANGLRNSLKEKGQRPAGTRPPSPGPCSLTPEP